MVSPFRSQPAGHQSECTASGASRFTVQASRAVRPTSTTELPAAASGRAPRARPARAVSSAPEVRATGTGRPVHLASCHQRRRWGARSSPTPHRVPAPGRIAVNSPVTACLAATYGGRPSTGAKPATDPISTTRPRRRRSAGRAASGHRHRGEVGHVHDPAGGRSGRSRRRRRSPTGPRRAPAGRRAARRRLRAPPAATAAVVGQVAPDEPGVPDAGRRSSRSRPTTVSPRARSRSAMTRADLARGAGDHEPPLSHATLLEDLVHLAGGLAGQPGEVAAQSGVVQHRTVQQELDLFGPVPADPDPASSRRARSAPRLGGHRHHPGALGLRRCRAWSSPRRRRRCRCRCAGASTPLTMMSATSWSQTKLNGPSVSGKRHHDPTGEQRRDLVVGVGSPRIVPAAARAGRVRVQPPGPGQQRLDRGLVPGVGELRAAGDRHVLGERRPSLRGVVAVRRARGW